MKDQSEDVMNIVRKMEGAPSLEFTGEYVPDPEQVKAWEQGPNQEYNGEYRYFNKPPTVLRKLLEEEKDESEKVAIEAAIKYWMGNKGLGDPDDPRATIAGEPYRGEPKPDIRFNNLKDSVKDRKPVSHITVMGDMRRDSFDVGAEIGQRGLPDSLKNFEGLGMVEGPGGIWEEV
jgi:hypothetical protein